MAPSRMAEQVGRVLGGRYRLLAPVGAGASAQVFVAEDVVLRRRVAAKVLHPALADDEAFLRRFRAEAQAAAALSHPNLLAVYDWGEDDDGPYLVTEYLSGGSLRTLLDRGTLLSTSQALLIGLDAARGLDHAHRRGLVHRDIKPANLLFDDEGRLRIADFGIARALAEAGWTEPSGAVVGSARYASPEQARGQSLDARSDIYSLGLVLVEAVTGEVPFTADTTIATLMARIDTTLVAPSELGPLGTVVEWACRPEPADRPTAAQLGAALNNVAAELPRPEALPLGESIAVDTAPAVDPDPTLLPAARAATAAAAATEKPDPAVRRRRRWPYAVLAALVVLAGGGAAAWAIVQSRIPSHPVPNVINAAEAEARQRLEALEFDVRIERRFVDGTVKGQVLDQEPERGNLKEGRTVTLTVSNGPPLIAVPDLANADRATAETRLREAGFTPKVEERFHEDIPKGIVLEWAGAGDRAPKGSEIGVVVSGGPQPRVLSDWRGKTFEEAATAFEQSGLRAQRREVFSDDVPAGQIVSTEPPAGRQVAKGATVIVNISKGPDLVAVPDVRRLTVEQATARIEEAGLRVTNVFGPIRGRVFTSNPAGGVKVKRGAGVDIYTR